MFHNIALGALSEGDTTGALQNLAEAEALDPHQTEFHHTRARAFYFRKETILAETEVRRAIELDPKNSGAQNTLGKLLFDQGKSSEAQTHLMLAANDPLYYDAYKAWTLLGIIQYRNADYKKAKDYFDRAIISSPMGACIAYYYRGHVQLRDSLFGEAIRDYSLASRQFCAGFADAHLALGLAYEQSKQFDQARKKYLEIQTSFPSTRIAEQAMNHLRYLP